MVTFTTQQIESAIRLYRIEHPRSRAESTWTYVGSTGCVTRATCVFCRREIATCSAKWRKTKAFWASIADHREHCESLADYAARGPIVLAERAAAERAAAEIAASPTPERPIELDDSVRAAAPGLVDPLPLELD